MPKKLISFSNDKARRILEKHEVAIFPFNSNDAKNTISFATGEIGKTEIKYFKECVEKLREDNEDLYSRSLKIALLHHHPIPIASSETDNIKDSDMVLLLKNAGTFIREISNYSIDLILHGHKHCPHISRIKYNIGNGDEFEITIVSAGSACIPSANNSYNIIKYFQLSKIEIERRDSLNGGDFYIKKNIEFYPYEVLREKQYFSELAKCKDNL